MDQISKNFWIQKLEPLELYGEKIQYDFVITKEHTALEVLPLFPYKNQNKGDGSPLLKLLEDLEKKKA